MAPAKTNAFQGRPTATIVDELLSIKELLLGVDERIIEILARNAQLDKENPAAQPPSASTGETGPAN